MLLGSATIHTMLGGAKIPDECQHPSDIMLKGATFPLNPAKGSKDTGVTLSNLCPPDYR